MVTCHSKFGPQLRASHTINSGTMSTNPLVSSPAAAAVSFANDNAATSEVRSNWSREEVAAIYRIPLPELIFRAQTIHRKFHAPDRVQTCQLISIKTGGCPEDCAYCPQSAHYDADVERQGLLDPQHVISVAREACITVCRGGIFGMGESERDRIGLLHQLATLEPHPESVPINMLVRVAGTPLADRPALDPLEMVRAIATARVLMPASRVRLAAGRKQLSPEAVTLCFLAGAHSIFVGEKVLTTPTPGVDEDEQLLQTLGLKPLESHAI